VKVTNYINKNCIICDLKAESKEEVLRKLAVKAVEVRPELDLEKIIEVLVERERLGTTGIGNGIAIPHGKLVELDKIIIVFGRSQEGVPFEAADNRPVHIVFLILAPEGAATTYLKILAQVSRLVKSPEVRQRLLDADTADKIIQIINEAYG